jgi:hypothetical protein
MSTYTQVTMGVTDKDINNVEKLKHFFKKSNNAEVVAIALALTSCITDHIGDGSQLIIKNNGIDYKITMPGLID